MPDISARKRHIHRKKVKGYSHDALRAFAHTTFHGAYNLAKVMYSDKLEAALQAMKAAQQDSDDREKASDIFAEMQKRHEWIMNPINAGWVNTVSAVGFFMYLGATPAAALVNTTQTALVAFPILAANPKFGMAKASAALLKASKDIIRGKGSLASTLSGDRKRAYEQFVREGVIDKTLSHDLAGIGDSPSDTYNPVQQKVMEKVAFLFHKAEVFNREATSMAAYDLSRDAGMSHEAAMTYARDATFESHYDYSNANRARFMQGNAAKVFFMFRQFSFNMVWTLGRNFHQSLWGESKAVKLEARKKLTGILGMHAIFAGTMGLPLFGTVSMVANIMSSIFGDDDEPYDFKIEFRNFLHDYLPDDLADIIAKGAVNKLTGADIAGRVGLNQLLFREPDRDMGGKDTVVYMMEQLGGPMAGMIGQIGYGLDLVNEGHYWRGVEQALPKFLKDYSRAIRYAKEGVLTKKGDPILEDINPWEIFLKSQGMNPTALTEAYDKNNAIMTYQGRVEDRRSRLMAAAALSRMAGDFDAYYEVRQKIRAFGQKYPKFKIETKDIDQSIRSRKANRRDAQGGILTNPNLKELREVGRFAG